MRIMISAAAAMGVLLGSSAAGASDHGEEVFRTACSTCHVESMSAEEADHADNIVAPPMNLLSTIIWKKTGNNDAAFVNHVIDFTNDPAVEKVKAMPEAVRRFGLMPPVSETFPDLSEDDIRAVAEWLLHRYDYSKELDELMAHEASNAAK